MSQVRMLAKRVAAATLRRRYCPICESHQLRFLPHNGRSDARCPQCRSMERHRLLWRFFERQTNLFDHTPKRMLHVAPEWGIRGRLGCVAGLDYVSADLCRDDVMEKMDVTDIRHPDGSFDVVCCSHVLEHVDDDRKAMRELARVLAPSGWAVLMVPIIAKQTREDPSITDPRERARVFGQHNHVRAYGPDFADRLGEAGFVVEVFGPSDVLSAEEVKRFRAGGEVFYCRRHECAS